MRISAKAEYACVAMLELAASHGEPQPRRIKAIADAQGIPQRFLVQILLQLKTAGLVASVRGASGGYQLTRPPAEISLASIINAIDDRTLTPRSALGEANRTPIVGTLLSVWQEIQTREQRMLEQLTLAELLLRTRQSDALSYQI
jgi:Rrf2 family protein